MKGIRIATYNIHKCIGLDRRVSVDRIGRVLRELDADVVALQEVVIERERSRRRKHSDQAELLGEITGLQSIVGAAIDRPGHVYGNVVLSRLPIVGFENFDISASRREPRACIRVDIALDGGQVIHVYNTHFGTSHPERVEQSKLLVESGILEGSHPEHAQVLAGDFNDWFSGSPTRLLGDHFHEATRRLKPTYPAVAPVVRLDRIYVNKHVRVRRIEAHKSRLALVSSDHAPILAVLDVEAQPAESTAGST